MSKRVCAEPGCPEITDTTRCPAHTKAKDKARGTRRERGYDRAYDLDRQRQARRVATGTVACWACHKRITVLEPWHNGHCEDDRTVLHGPEHPACNLGHIGKPCPHISHVTEGVGGRPPNAPY